MINKSKGAWDWFFGLILETNFRRFYIEEYLTRLIDMPTLSTDLTPLAKELSEELQKPIDAFNLLLKSSDDYKEINEIFKERLNATQSCGESVGIIAIGEIYDRTIDTIKRHSKLPIVQKAQVENDTSILKILIKKFQKYVDEIFSDMDKRDRELITILLLELGCGCKISQNLENELLGLAKKLSLVMKNPKLLAKLLFDIEKNGGQLIFHGDQPNLIKEAVSQQKEFSEETMYAFVRASGCLKRIFAERALIPVSWEENDTTIALYKLRQINDKDGINLFLALCEASGLKDMKLKEVYGELVKKFNLSRKEQIELLRQEPFAGKDIYRVSTVQNIENIEEILKIIKNEKLCPYKNLENSTPKYEGEYLEQELEKYCKMIIDASKTKTLPEFLESIKQVIKTEEQNADKVENVNTWDRVRFLKKLASKITFEIKDTPWYHESNLTKISTWLELKMDTSDIPELSYNDIPTVLKLIRNLPDPYSEYDFISANFLDAQMIFKLKNSRDQRESAIVIGYFRNYIGLMLIDDYDMANDSIQELIFEKLVFDPQSIDSLNAFLDASLFVSKKDIKLNLQYFLLRKMTRLLSMEEMEKLLFEDDRISNFAHLDIKEDFVEQNIKESRHLDGLLKKILSDVIPTSETYKNAGIVIFGERVVGDLIKNPLKLLKVLLSTSKDEKELFMIIYYNKNGNLEDTNMIRNDFNDTRLTMDRIYNLDLPAKYALVQTFLIGENGILKDERAKIELIKWFFAEFIEEPETNNEKTAYDLLKKGFAQIARKADTSTLYFMIAPLLAERILLRPKQRTKISDVDSNILDEKTDKIKEDFYNWEAVIISLIESDKKEEKQVKINAVEFVKQLGSKLGSPGVRFLQMLGLYVKIPKEIEQDFSGVYDSAKGQTKLAAYHSIKRQTPELIEEGLELGERVGGGSIFTVYRAQIQGKKYVVKVANPNAEFHNDGVCKVIADALASEDTFVVAVPLITDIKVSIVNDLKEVDPRIEGKFRQTNLNYTVEGNRYSIYVPLMYFSCERIRVEEFIEGINLTQSEKLIEAGHDLKQIAGLSVKSFVYQIQNGVVHSDLHAGNIRVTPDNEVALLDRGYY